MADLFHLNGCPFQVELLGEGPAVLHAEVSAAQELPSEADAFDDERDTVTPVANC